MAPEPRFSDPGLFGSGRAYVQPQPKGVIGNIVPWNFPFDLSVGPLVEMLAAGNRVVIKPSEYTPACAALLQHCCLLQWLRSLLSHDRRRAADVTADDARVRAPVTMRRELRRWVCRGRCPTVGGTGC